MPPSARPARLSLAPAPRRGHHDLVSRDTLGDPGPDADDLEADLDVAPDTSGPRAGRDGGDDTGPGTDGGRPARRGVSARVLLVAGAVTALVVGALGGSLATAQQESAARDAATRLVLVVEPGDGGPDDVGAPAPVGDDLVLVTVSLAGALDPGEELVVERVDTPVGALTLFPTLRLRAGAPPWRTLLRGRIDCSAVDPRLPVDGRVLAGATAQLSRPGSGRPFTVDVLVANPAQTVGAVATRCLPRDPAQDAQFEVDRMTARANGTVFFVVSPVGRPDPEARFGLVTYEPGVWEAEPLPGDAEGDRATFRIPGTSWTVTTLPALPRAVTEPTFVLMRFEHPCEATASRRVPAPALPTWDRPVVGTTLDGNGTPGDLFTPGWDDSAVFAAATAAVARACADAGR